MTTPNIERKAYFLIGLITGVIVALVIVLYSKTSVFWLSCLVGAAGFLLTKDTAIIERRREKRPPMTQAQRHNHT